MRRKAGLSPMLKAVSKNGWRSGSASIVTREARSSNSEAAATGWKSTRIGPPMATPWRSTRMSPSARNSRSDPGREATGGRSEQSSNREEPNAGIPLAKLSKYLAPQVYSSIFTGKQEVGISSKRKKLTVFFSDIADFTATTDSLDIGATRPSCSTTISPRCREWPSNLGPPSTSTSATRS